MSDSVWPHRRQPTRLPRPWDSPGKNTGVGCHFLLQSGLWTPINLKYRLSIQTECFLSALHEQDDVWWWFSKHMWLFHANPLWRESDSDSQNLNGMFHQWKGRPDLTREENLGTGHVCVGVCVHACVCRPCVCVCWRWMVSVPCTCASPHPREENLGTGQTFSITPPCVCVCVCVCVCWRWMVSVPCTCASPHPSPLSISLWLWLTMFEIRPSLCIRDLRIMNWKLQSISSEGGKVVWCGFSFSSLDSLTSPWFLGELVNWDCFCWKAS